MTRNTAKVVPSTRGGVRGLQGALDGSRAKGSYDFEQHPRLSVPSQTPPRPRRLAKAVGCFGGLLLALQGCAPAQIRAPATMPTVLRVGLVPDRPPLAYWSDNRLVGLEIDIARLAGASLGRPVEFRQLSARTLTASLASDQVDTVMGDLSEWAPTTPASRLSLPYLRTGQFVAIRTADLAVFQGPDALADSGARVGYVQGTPGEGYAREHLPHSNAYRFDDGGAAIRSLRSHRIDFFVHQEPELIFLTSGAPPGELLVLPRALTEREFGFAVAPGQAELLSELNTFIDRAMANRSLENVRDLWLSGRPRPAD